MPVGAFLLMSLSAIRPPATELAKCLADVVSSELGGKFQI